MIPFDRLAYKDSTKELFEGAQAQLARAHKTCVPARVISLDRGFPLVCSYDFEARAELATSIKKSDDSIIAIGDWVALWCPHGHEKSVIECVLPRENEIARIKRVGREQQIRRQVLAANVDVVFICHSLTGDGVDERLLIRQMAAVAGSGAKPVFVLTKGDLVSQDRIDTASRRITAIAPDVPLFVTSLEDPDSIQRLTSVISMETTALLLGESGVGKSSLVNALLGEDHMQVGEVRHQDDKGRHTTVARKIIALPHKGLIIDAPGLRTLNILDKEKSLKRAFPDIEEAAASCKFSDCSHGGEPGCAVQGTIAEERLNVYNFLKNNPS